jgi:hypothetical protein
MTDNDLKGFRGVYVLVQSLNPSKRVRLIDGRLTPVFEYSSQAFNYASSRGIVNCRIINLKKRKVKGY